MGFEGDGQNLVFMVYERPLAGIVTGFYDEIYAVDILLQLIQEFLPGFFQAFLKNFPKISSCFFYKFFLDFLPGFLLETLQEFVGELV